MQYTSSAWKHKLRSLFYKMIPARLYVAIMPLYYKFFSSLRRSCTYRFEIDKDERIVLIDNNTRFYFIGFRRMNRYLYPDGLGRKKASMRKKYCIPGCSVENGDIVVEVGANVGEFTLMASERAKMVYSFEPDPDVGYCLKENTRALVNVEVVEFAASRVDSNETYYLSSEDADSSLLKPKIFSRAIEIKTVRLDSWMATKGLTQIDFLKVEAEGAEVEVLEGLGDRIEFVQKVSVDGGRERYGEATAADVDQYLQSKGFNTQIIGYHVYAWRTDS